MPLPVVLRSTGIEERAHSHVYSGVCLVNWAYPHLERYGVCLAFLLKFRSISVRLHGENILLHYTLPSEDESIMQSKTHIQISSNLLLKLVPWSNLDRSKYPDI